MHRTISLAVLAASLLVSSAIAGEAAEPPRAKVSPSKAGQIAAKAIHGRSIKTTYEFEDGRWQYAVLVMKGKQMYEVEVSSTNGKVLDTERTSAAEEAKEAAADRAAASKKGSRHHKSAAAGAGEKGEKGEANETGR